MSVKVIECPRDAMQGLHDFIPTENKISYLNDLLKVGFHSLDFGSFVSPKAIPQLRDTEEVLAGLDLSETKTKLLAIIGNYRGAENACKHPEIDYLGFPFSISPTFLNLNIHSTTEQAMETIEKIQNLCVATNKKLIVYLSMVFGNPYGDDSSVEANLEAVRKLHALGIEIVSLSDTVGMGNPEIIGNIFKELVPAFSGIEFGLHLHTTANTFYDKLDSAYENGCRRFDSVMLGLGGCPMANYDLVGNLSTESLINFFTSKEIDLHFNFEKYRKALHKAQETFPLN